jgi:hypothetical protein
VSWESQRLVSNLLGALVVFLYRGGVDLALPRTPLRIKNAWKAKYGGMDVNEAQEVKQLRQGG